MVAFHPGTKSLRRGHPVIAALLLLGASGPAAANTFWVDLPHPAQAAGQSIALRIGLGHRYPESRSVIRRKADVHVTVRRPDGTTESVELRPGTNVLTGSLAPREPGPHLVSVEVRNPRDTDAPSFAKAIFEAGGRGGPPASYRLNRTLEIAPIQSIADLVPGERRSFLVLHEGRPVTADIRVLPPDRRAFSVPSRAGPTPIFFQQSGAYLMTTYHEGREATLTLRVTGNAPR